MSKNKIPKRPNKKTADISEAINEIALLVEEWSNNEESIDEICEEIEAAYRDSWYESDGFKLAKQMEDSCYYIADYELVHIMSNLDWAVRKCIKKAEKAWVKAYKIEPKFYPEESITITAAKLREENNMEGIITDINFDQAKYTVLIPELGHVREGLGTHGRIYNFEDLHELEAKVAI